MKIKVESNPGLVRDSNSNGIINVDDAAYALHKKNKQTAKMKIEKEQAQEARINKLENDVSELKGDIKEILRMLSYGKI